MSATPRPWWWERQSDGNYAILAKQGPIKVQPATAHGKDDAELIVSAVKCHDELVAALEWILRDLPTRRNWLDPDCERFMRAVLAKAKEEPA